LSSNVDAEVERTLERSFSAVAAELMPLRDRVLARLDRAPRERERRREPPLPFLGRKRTLFLLVNAFAAAMLLTAYVGYLMLGRMQRQALAAEARCEVRNLAIVLRALRERGTAPAEPREALAGALARLGIERDPFGNPFACDSARVYSYGLNGRDDGGAGDDIVAYLR
jgi:hypothetical protein